jgi:hypothetical protein
VDIRFTGRLIRKQAPAHEQLLRIALIILDGQQITNNAAWVRQVGGLVEFTLSDSDPRLIGFEQRRLQGHQHERLVERAQQARQRTLKRQARQRVDLGGCESGRRAGSDDRRCLLGNTAVMTLLVVGDHGRCSC